MRKIVFPLFLVALLATPLTVSLPAEAAAKMLSSSATHLEPTKADNQDAAAVQAVQAVLHDLINASNKHDLDGVLKHYSLTFTSGDSLSLKDVRGLIQDTWQMFPDIHYDSQVLEIRTSGNWATVESIDTATATAKIDPVVSNKPGNMKSRSRGMLYLHKVGKQWEILSDATLYEKATIIYGPFDGINIDVESPEQVFAGDSYTAKVKVGVPSGNIAFATLSQEPLTYPQHASKDKFRTLSSDKTDLERIFKANNTNNNEVITATVGFTEIGQDEQERPTINLKGIMTVVKRVNVIPKSTFQADNAAKAVNVSADGKIKIDTQRASSGHEDNESNDGLGGQTDMENPSGQE
jgi:ketosteroid isomerase-like protein